MLRNDSFYLIRIEGEPYILPVGQMVADHMRGVKINETGCFIWDCLKEDLSEEELNNKCFDYFEAEEDDKEEIKEGILEFVALLKSRGMVREKSFNDDQTETPAKITYAFIGTDKNAELDFIKSAEIAGIKISFYGDSEALTDKFDAFAGECSDCDLRIEITHDNAEQIDDGISIIKDAPVETKEYADGYILKFPESSMIKECRLNKEGSLARFYINDECDESEKELLFHAIRTVFLYKALQKGMAAIHSVSILYQDRAWLFSASSGTGKSTHASLWDKLYDVKMINGDLNLLGIKDDKPTIFGLPWCGTSNTFDTKEYELGGVILLRRNHLNFVEDLKEDEKQLFVQQRIISPTWDEKMLAKQLEIVGKAVKSPVTVARLNCTKDDEAAVVMKEYIDSRVRN